jgi:siroheme synthase-like protein
MSKQQNTVKISTHNNTRSLSIAVTMSSFHHIVGASVNPFGDLILSSEVVETVLHNERLGTHHKPKETEAVSSSTVPKANTLFPMFVKLEQFRLLIVGGGAVGLEKLSAILANSPQTPITLVAREILPNLRALAADKENVQFVERAFRESDLDNHDFVIAATDDKALHHDIRRLARERRLLVNVADTPDLCDFYLSSIVQKGDLKIAISTNGKSPTLGKRLKEILNDVIPSDIHQTLQNLAVIRGKLNGTFAEKIQRMKRGHCGTCGKIPPAPFVKGEKECERGSGKSSFALDTAYCQRFGIVCADVDVFGAFTFSTCSH